MAGVNDDNITQRVRHSLVYEPASDIQLRVPIRHPAVLNKGFQGSWDLNVFIIYTTQLEVPKHIIIVMRDNRNHFDDAVRPFLFPEKLFREV